MMATRKTEETTMTEPKPITQVPSPHVVHSAAFGNVLNAKLAEFDSSIAALEGDMEGKARAYAEGRQMDELLLADLQRAKKAAESALDALSDIERVQPEQGQLLDQDNDK